MIYRVIFSFVLVLLFSFVWLIQIQTKSHIFLYFTIILLSILSLKNLIAYIWILVLIFFVWWNFYNTTLFLVIFDLLNICYFYLMCRNTKILSL